MFSCSRSSCAVGRRPTLVPAVRLAGVIGSVGLGGRGMTLAGLERALDAAFGHKHARAVALRSIAPAARRCSRR